MSLLSLSGLLHQRVSDPAMATPPDPSADATSPSTVVSSLPPIFNPIQFHHSINPKLDDSNFLLWKSQVVPVIRGHGLLPYLDGTISADSSSASSSMHHENCVRQDQLILAWLLASLGSTVLPQAIGCKTSADLWGMVHRMYSNQSQSRVLELKLKLQTLKKGDLSCSEYLNSLTAVALQLRSIGCDISDQDLCLYLLAGLPSDYNPLVTSLTSTNSALSLADLHGHLLNYERRLYSQLTSVDPSSSAYLALGAPNPPLSNGSGSGFPGPMGLPSNLAQKGLSSLVQPDTSSFSSPAHAPDLGSLLTPLMLNSLPWQSQQQLAAAYLAQQFKRNPSRGGRGRGHSNGRGRFSRSYGGASGGNSGRGKGPNPDVQCQICTKVGHAAKECWYRYDDNPNGAPQVNIAQPSSSSPSAEWFLDSGASTHITPDLNCLTDYHPYQGNSVVRIGNGHGLAISHTGSSYLDSQTKRLNLHGVLHVPHMTKRLLSISQLTKDNDIIVEFNESGCVIKDSKTHQVLLEGGVSHGLYYLPCHQSFVSEVSTGKLWHHRLGHTSSSVMNHLAKNKLVSFSPSVSPCDACNKYKSHRLPFSLVSHRATKPLELLHADVWGPSPTLSKQGNRYYVLFVDDFSRFSWIFVCSAKSFIPSIFRGFKVQIENLLSSSIKTIQCDGGTEFKPLMSQFPEITFRVSCPYTPEQNGVVERKHRHLVELALATMSQAFIPTDYWDHIFESVVFIINRLPSSVLDFTSPYELLFKNAPDYSFFKVLGCLCYPWLRPYAHNKLELRSIPCVFLGYSSLHKGYKCLHLPTNRIYISRHVIFHETTYPFASLSSSEPSPLSSSPPPPHILTILPSSLPLQPISSPPSPPPPSPHNSVPTPLTSFSPLPLLSPPPPTHHMTTRTKDRTRQTRTFPDFVTYTSAALDVSEPTCFTEANKNPEWQRAMAHELTALAQNQTWDLVPCPNNHNIVGCKWVYKVKRKADGTIERFKARLVAKGYTQEEGLDYTETFSPVVKPVTIRTLLSLAISKGWSLRQLDVNNAFLHGNLEEVVYMAQPPGFVNPDLPTHVCRLKKALYGLKQAPRAWFHRLRDFLISHGFTCSQSDSSLFLKRSSHEAVYLLVYVDDIIITGTSPTLIDHITSSLHATFTIKDLGCLSFFLGIEAISTSSGLLLSQNRYIGDLLHRAKMDGAKPVATPMQTGLQLSKSDGDPFSDTHLYRSIVGALQYVTITRPEIAFAVNRVSLFMHEPTDIHWSAVKRILRYLKGTITHGLLLRSSSHLSLQVFSDADWAGHPDDRRSTTSYCVYLGNSLVSWSSKKQPTVARSSTEAEYRALASAAAEVVWLQSLLHELIPDPISAPVLWCDNLGATFLAANPVHHARTKHIEVDIHFVRDLVASKRILVRFLSSHDQVADILTKSLGSSRFALLKNKLCVHDNTQGLRGGVSHK